MSEYPALVPTMLLFLSVDIYRCSFSRRLLTLRQAQHRFIVICSPQRICPLLSIFLDFIECLLVRRCRFASARGSFHLLLGCQRCTALLAFAKKKENSWCYFRTVSLSQNARQIVHLPVIQRVLIYPWIYLIQTTKLVLIVGLPVCWIDPLFANGTFWQITSC